MAFLGEYSIAGNLFCLNSFQNIFSLFAAEIRLVEWNMLTHVLTYFPLLPIQIRFFRNRSRCKAYSAFHYGQIKMDNKSFLNPIRFQKHLCRLFHPSAASPYRKWIPHSRFDMLCLCMNTTSGIYRFLL